MRMKENVSRQYKKSNILFEQDLKCSLPKGYRISCFDSDLGVYIDYISRWDFLGRLFGVGRTAGIVYFPDYSKHIVVRDSRLFDCLKSFGIKHNYDRIDKEFPLT